MTPCHLETLVMMEENYRSDDMETEDTLISNVMKQSRQLTEDAVVFPTGIAALDEQIKGFQWGELITLLAYPGDDKLNLALRIISYQAVDNGISSAYFCTRETPEVVVRRLTCYRGSLLPNRLLDYEITGEPHEWKDWINGIREQIAASPIYLYPNKKMSTPDLCEQCMAYAKLCSVIYIYLSKDAIKDDVVCKLKSLACRMHVVIVLLIDVLGERSGLDKQPSFRDLAFCQLDEYSDIVIGFVDGDALDVVTDDNGTLLAGKVRFQVVKDRCNKQLEPFYLNPLGMFLREYSELPGMPSMPPEDNTGIYSPFDGE